jgi:CRP-like cAMP-binding protein
VHRNIRIVVMLQQNYVNGQCGTNGNGRDQRLLEGIVANLPLFRNISPAHVALVASQARLEHFRRGALIVQQGTPLPGVIAIAYGLAKLVLPRRKGDERVLRFVGANESFGEAATFLERPCPVDAVALADAMLAVIPVRALRQLQERDSAFANNLVRTLAEGLLGLVADIDARAGRSSAQRLAAYLHALARPQAEAASCAIQLPVTKTALAARLGITKETMSRLLRELKDQGLILMDRGSITILDRARLAGIAN